MIHEGLLIQSYYLANLILTHKTFEVSFQAHTAAHTHVQHLNPLPSEILIVHYNW